MLIKQNSIKKILKGYNLGKIKKIKPLTTSGNITFLIISEKGKFVLRLCPTGARWRSKKEILAELEIIEYLGKNNFPAPEAVNKEDGQKVINWQNHFGYLKKYANGKTILKPSLKQIEKFGYLIGQFHNLIENYKTRYSRNHIWNLEETKKWFYKNKNKIKKSNFKNKNNFILKFEKEIKSIFFPVKLPKGIIHEDLRKEHVLWQNNKIVSVLDFDRSYYGFLILDLGQAIRSWCFTNNWTKWDNRCLKSLLNGYNSKRKLKNIEKKYLFSAIKFAVLERAFSFSTRYLEETKSRKDEKFAWHSVSDNGLIGLLDKNKEKINKIIKAAYLVQEKAAD